ncbi:MAG: hypothetical protein AB7G93_11970 [Bdellovibrionales bacterium]
MGILSARNYKLAILLGVLVGVTGTAIKWTLHEGLRRVHDKTVRTAFPRRESPLNYDPANIQLAYEYIFLETIYSSLVEYDSEGNIKPGVAERFWWDEGRLNFQIKSGLETADGYEISAEDVIFSLKRVMILGGNTHGNLVDLLCGDIPLRHVDDRCIGLFAKGSIVTLAPRKTTPFLLSMLTGIDFAVIPRRAVDPKTLKIVEMKNTSGPMYLANVADGKIELLANPKHFNHDPKQPDRIVLISSVGKDSKESRALELFAEDKIDLITTIDTTSAESVLDFHLNNKSKTNFHSSLDIRMFLVRFSTSGIRSFSHEERFQIGPALVDSLRRAFSARKLVKTTDQILPHYGEGGLDQAIVDRIKAKYVEPRFDRAKKVRVYLMRLPDIEIFKAAVTEVLPNAKFFDTSEEILPNWGDDDTDIMISGPDLGFIEDISLYSYAVKSGILRTKEGPDKWLASYMGTLEKEERIRKIRDLHQYNLESGFAFPCFASPYVALSRNPWKITLPKLFANHPLWQIRLSP